MYTSALVAHQGGWDEILLVGVPIALIIGLLFVVKRRVDAQVDHTDAGTGPDNESAE